MASNIVSQHRNQTLTLWKDIANLRIKHLNNDTKSQHHAWMTINFKEEENESERELSTVCSQIVLKRLHLARIGRPDISWSVKNLLVRSQMEEMWITNTISGRRSTVMELASATPLNESKFSGERTTVTTSSLNTMGTKRKHKSADDDKMQADSLKKGDPGSGTSENGNELQTARQHELE